MRQQQQPPPPSSPERRQRNLLEDSDYNDGTTSRDDGGTTASGSSTSSSPTSSTMLSCGFNQDGGCLAVGTTDGFRVYTVWPYFALSVDRTSSSTSAEEQRKAAASAGGTTTAGGGGIGQVEMLFRCNLMALVGGGPCPRSPPHRVIIWDDHVPREVGELSFRQPVLRVKLRKDSIAVALRDRVYVYHLADLSLRDKIYTSDNPHGLLCLSTQIDDTVLACPSVTTGHVRVELYGRRKTTVRACRRRHNGGGARFPVRTKSVLLASLFSCWRISPHPRPFSFSFFQLLEAHESALRNVALTPSGDKLATASVKGTVVRVWDVYRSGGTCIGEFRRGVERATVSCLAWSWDAAFLACASDKGTAHVFRVSDAHRNRQQPGGGGGGGGESSSLSLSRILSSVRKSVEGCDAVKSVCQIRGVPHPQACAFVTDATVANHVLAVAGYDADGNGVVLLSEFSPNAAPSGGLHHPNHLHQHSSSSLSSTSQTHPIPEPRRVGYHVVCRSAVRDPSEEARRRRRLRGWTPEVPQSPEGGRLYVGERLEVLERGMETIRFEETPDDDEFVSVITTKPAAVAPPPLVPTPPQQAQQQQLGGDFSGGTGNSGTYADIDGDEIFADAATGEEEGVDDGLGATGGSHRRHDNDHIHNSGSIGNPNNNNNNSNVADSTTTGGDSFRTEPLDETTDESGSNAVDVVERPGEGEDGDDDIEDMEGL